MKYGRNILFFCQCWCLHYGFVLFIELNHGTLRRVRGDPIASRWFYECDYIFKFLINKYCDHFCFVSFFFWPLNGYKTHSTHPYKNSSIYPEFHTPVTMLLIWHIRTFTPLISMFNIISYENWLAILDY